MVPSQGSVRGRARRRSRPVAGRLWGCGDEYRHQKQWTEGHRSGPLRSMRLRACSAFQGGRVMERVSARSRSIALLVPGQPHDTVHIARVWASKGTEEAYRGIKAERRSVRAKTTIHNAFLVPSPLLIAIQPLTSHCGRLWHACTQDYVLL